MSEPMTAAGAALLAELTENPLPGARYAHQVVKMRLPKAEAEAAARAVDEALSVGGLVTRFVESVPAEDIIVMQRVDGKWEVYHMRYSDSPRQSSRQPDLAAALVAHLRGPR